MKLSLLPARVILSSLLAVLLAAPAPAEVAVKKTTNDTAKSTGLSSAQQLQQQLSQQQKRLQELERLVRQQAALLEALQQQLSGRADTPTLQNAVLSVSFPVSATTPARAAGRLSGEVDALAEDVDAVSERVARLEAETQQADKKLSEKLKGLGNFAFSGDLRIRYYEPFFQDGVPSRHRQRARLRFQVGANISKELRAGLRLATGSLGNPGSTNQTFTGSFTRKTVGLDRFWLEYNPEAAPWFKATAGKFAYTWYRTELTFDNDLNPEGFSEKFSFNFKNSPLANVTLVGFQLPFNEVSRGSDSIIWGGQVQTHWKLGGSTRLGFHVAGINFRNADAIARAIGAGTLSPSLPLSNNVVVDSSGNIIGYVLRFAYFNLIAQLDHQLTSRWPLRLTLDFVNNTRAADGERSGYWAEVALGRSQEKGDWKFGYTLMRIEKDAVIGAFNFDDMRSATNVLQHRVYTSYRVHDKVSLDYTLLLGHLFNPQDNLNLVPSAFQPLNQDPFLKRMQFDVVYRF